MKNCKECGKPFAPKNPKGIFCSLACRQKDYRKKKNKEFEGYRTAVANIKSQSVPLLEPPEKKQETPKRSSIVRTVSWYVKEIQALGFEEEYVNMAQMIDLDGGLSKKEKADLLLSIKPNKF